MTHDSFSGTWHCRYWYPSNEHSGEDVSEYKVKIQRDGNKLKMTSLPTENGAYMMVGLTLDGNLATGKWLECTAPEGLFEGMVYSGAMQLIVADDQSRMDGKWVGVGREKIGDDAYEQRIYSGKWELARTES